MRLNNYKYTERWTWCDALFMAPPVWAKLASITGNDRFRNEMFAEYVATVNHLYDKEEKLFYREASQSHGETRVEHAEQKRRAERARRGLPDRKGTQLLR